MLEKALEASGDDLDSAIKSLNELRLESTGLKSENGQHTVIQPSVEGCFSTKDPCFPLMQSCFNNHTSGNELMEAWVLILPFEFVHEYYLEPYYITKVSLIC